MHQSVALICGIAAALILTACDRIEEPGSPAAASGMAAAWLDSTGSAGPTGIPTAASTANGAIVPGGDPTSLVPGASGASSSTRPADQRAGPDPASPEPLAAPVGTQANDILERAERAYAQVRSMEADFTQEVYVPLLESTKGSRGKLYHRAPDRFLMRFDDPRGDVVVADGRYVWMYYPSTDARQVIRAPLSEGGQQVDLQREFLSNASERYTATRTGSASVGGRQTDALTLIPRASSPYRQIRIWVDTQDFLIRRFEIIEQNGTRRDLQMSGLRPNVTLPDGLFEFTPPPGAEVFEP